MRGWRHASKQTYTAKHYALTWTQTDTGRQVASVHKLLNQLKIPRGHEKQTGNCANTTAFARASVMRRSVEWQNAILACHIDLKSHRFVHLRIERSLWVWLHKERSIYCIIQWRSAMLKITSNKRITAKSEISLSLCGYTYTKDCKITERRSTVSCDVENTNCMLNSVTQIILIQIKCNF